MNNRITWLDIAKGIVIILMIIGHTGIPHSVSNIIFAFHMPFFFVASGITTDFTKDTFSVFVARKFKTLGIPFVIYSSVNLILWPIVKGDNYCTYIKEWVINGWGGVALWFIPVLFFSLILAKSIYLLKSKRMKFITVVFFVLISGFLCYYNVYLPWNLSVVPFATFFIIIGDLTKSHLLQLSSLSGRYIYATFVAFIFMSVISQYWRLDMAYNAILPVIPKVFAALCGCFFVAKVSIFLEKHDCKFMSRAFQKIGKETYLILAFSQIIIFFTNTYLKVNVVEKYILLTIVLVLITLFKNKALKAYKIKS